ncbi:hypothetical protein J2Z69_002775 [Paenibacillus shirakamiensis]|uniref:Uncharacterized protein n=1 Tax=Paenibacillus shirakamiensis TaxID=1265935 RepID=A0ABS4JKX5_9BACL|nr:hypothetical protein [Paenibacillus shirakamiensis]
MNLEGAFYKHLQVFLLLHRQDFTNHEHYQSFIVEYSYFMVDIRGGDP